MTDNEKILMQEMIEQTGLKFNIMENSDETLSITIDPIKVDTKVLKSEFLTFKPEDVPIFAFKIARTLKAQSVMAFMELMKQESTKKPNLVVPEAGSIDIDKLKGGQ